MPTTPITIRTMTLRSMLVLSLCAIGAVGLKVLFFSLDQTIIDLILESRQMRRINRLRDTVPSLLPFFDPLLRLGGHDVGDDPSEQLLLTRLDRDDHQPSFRD